VVGLGAHVALNLSDRHLAYLGKQLSQMAIVLRVKMLNQYECHAGVVRQMAEQLRECIQSTCGGPNTDDWELTVYHRGGTLDRQRGDRLQVRFRAVLERSGGAAVSG
jgi:hypothetical protein